MDRSSRSDSNSNKPFIAALETGSTNGSSTLGTRLLGAGTSHTCLNTGSTTEDEKVPMR